MQSPIRNSLDYATPPAGPRSDRGRAAVGWMFVAMLLGGLACPCLAVFVFDVGRGSVWAVVGRRGRVPAGVRRLGDAA